MILKVFVAGWIILIVAMGINLIASRLGIDTWYPFAESIGKAGFIKAFVKASFLSKLFLFVIYPALLGVSAYFALKLIK